MTRRLFCVWPHCAKQNAGTDRSAFPLPEPQDVFLASQVKFDDLGRDLAQLGRDLTSTCRPVLSFFLSFLFFFLSASEVASVKSSVLDLE